MRRNIPNRCAIGRVKFAVSDGGRAVVDRDGSRWIRSGMRPDLAGVHAGELRGGGAALPQPTGDLPRRPPQPCVPRARLPLTASRPSSFTPTTGTSPRWPPRPTTQLRAMAGASIALRRLRRYTRACVDPRRSTVAPRYVVVFFIEQFLLESVFLQYN
jgi:hypothetical protein